MSALREGTSVLYLPERYQDEELYWVSEACLWHLTVRGDELRALVRYPLDRYPDPDRFLPAAFAGDLRPPSAVPAALWERARRLPTRAAALLTALRAENGWISRGDRFWHHDPRAGILRVKPGLPAQLSPDTSIDEDLPAALWSCPDLDLAPPPAALAAEIDRAIAAAHEEETPILGGQAALIDGGPGESSAVIFEVAGRVVWCRFDKEGRLEQRAAQNPREALIPRSRLRKLVYEHLYSRDEHERRWRFAPLPAAAQAARPVLAAGLGKSPELALEEFLDQMRAGRTLSGGADTSSWTISWQGDDFWLSGYREGEDGGYQPYRERYGEEKVRAHLRASGTFGPEEPGS
jgi:hypothetical protein